MPAKAKSKPARGRPSDGRTARLTVRLTPEAKEGLQRLRGEGIEQLSEGKAVERLIIEKLRTLD